MHLKIALIVAFTAFGATASQAAVTCQDLVRYRDNDLSKAIGNSIDRSSKISNARKALAELKSEVAAGRRGAQIVGNVSLILQALKTASDAVGGIVSLAPGSGQAIAGASGWARRVLEGQAVLDRAQMDEPFSLLLYEMAQAKGGLLSAAQTIKDFYSNLKNLSEAKKESEATLGSLDDAISVADTQLAKLDADLRKQETKIALINRVKNQIDSECNKR